MTKESSDGGFTFSAAKRGEKCKKAKKMYEREDLGYSNEYDNLDRLETKT